MKYIMMIICMFWLTVASGYTDSFKTYHNARFNYQVSYPNFLKPQGESVNSDGQVIKNDNAKLIVWGAYQPSTIDEGLRYAMNDLKIFTIKYKLKGKNYFVLRGENKKQTFYFKTIYVCDENINLQLFYPKDDKSKWDAIVTRISQSFKYSSAKCQK